MTPRRLVCRGHCRGTTGTEFNARLVRYGRGVCALLGFVGLFAAACFTPCLAAESYRIDIPRAPADQSLVQLGAQTRLKISVDLPGIDVRSYLWPNTNAISGTFTTAAALEVMFAGTGLTYAFTSSDRVEVRRAFGPARWYDIPAGPAYASLQEFVETLGWDVSVDRTAALHVMTPAVRGCFSPEQAANNLLAGTPLTYSWLGGEKRNPGTPIKSLIVKPRERSRFMRLIRTERVVKIGPKDPDWRCWRPCSSTQAPPPPTCVRYLPSAP